MHSRPHFTGNMQKLLSRHKITYVFLVVSVVIAIGFVIQDTRLNQSISKDDSLPTLLAAGRVDARGEKHYFLSSSTTTGAANGYSGLDAKCEADSNAIAGRKYHVYAGAASGRGFIPGVMYTNTQYGTFAITGTQDPDLCRVMRISCDSNWTADAPWEYVWNTGINACNSWSSTSPIAGNNLYQPFRTANSAGTVSTSPGGLLCSNSYRFICIEDSVAVSDPSADPFFVSQTKNWTDAQTHCASFGAHLAYIDSAATNTTIKNLAGGNSIWIGYNDRSSEGTFVWDGGLGAVYTTWGWLEPNNAGNEDCTEMRTDGNWNDLKCNNAKPFVCTY